MSFAEKSELRICLCEQDFLIDEVDAPTALTQQEKDFIEIFMLEELDQDWFDLLCEEELNTERELNISLTWGEDGRIEALDMPSDFVSRRLVYYSYIAVESAREHLFNNFGKK